jgi:cell division protein FtsA
VAGLLMFSQSDTQDTIVEQDDVERLSLAKRVKRALFGFNDTLKSIF